MDGACTSHQPMGGPTIITTAELGYCKRKKKRFRTSFSAWQLTALEAQFHVQQYLVGEQRAHFAEQLGLGPVLKFNFLRHKTKAVKNGIIVRPLFRHRSKFGSKTDGFASERTKGRRKRKVYGNGITKGHGREQRK
ncbi:hypothetical protein niasHT_028142 [Heterodera trifolii]|uniref:Homeobox domain-containing protein n=1 Tax=Heterodera trifolii TaxID=157864 RepID=A0ABD2JNS5_9BILA